jgi:hypothetical protein
MTEKEALEIRQIGIPVCAGQFSVLGDIARSHGLNSVRGMFIAIAQLLYYDPEAINWARVRSIAKGENVRMVNAAWYAHVNGQRLKRKGAKND